MFFCKFCEISKNTFSTEHLQTTASVCYTVKVTLTVILAMEYLHSVRCYEIKYKNRYDLTKVDEAIITNRGGISVSFINLILAIKKKQSLDGATVYRLLIVHFSIHQSQNFPCGIYLVKTNNDNTRKMCEIC